MKLIMAGLVLIAWGLAGCSETKRNEETQQKQIEFQKTMQEGNAYASALLGKCFVNWYGSTFIIEKATEFYKDVNGSAICNLGKVCDYKHPSRCIILKHCSSYSRNDYLQEKLKEDKMRPVKCPVGYK
jgi:hypothetical protein